MNELTLETMKRTGRVTLRVLMTPEGTFLVNTPGTLRFPVHRTRTLNTGQLRGVTELHFVAGELGRWVGATLLGQATARCYRSQ